MINYNQKISSKNLIKKSSKNLIKKPHQNQTPSFYL